MAPNLKIAHDPEYVAVAVCVRTTIIALEYIVGDTCKASFCEDSNDWVDTDDGASFFKLAEQVAMSTAINAAKEDRLFFVNWLSSKKFDRRINKCSS